MIMYLNTSLYLSVDIFVVDETSYLVFAAFDKMFS